MLIALTALVGLCFGSFANVLIARIPAGESVVSPPSHCPHCQHQLGVADLVPVVSYLWLRGRCRYCQERISSRYPLVELATAGLFVLVHLQQGWSAGTLAGWALALILLTSALTDIDAGIIPDLLTYPGMVLGLVFSPWGPGIISSLEGAFFFGGLFWLLAFISGGGMGGGDIKLAVVIGLFTGLSGSLLALVLAALSGGIFSLVLVVMGKAGRKTPIKFGPFLALAGMVAFLYAGPIIKWYLGIF